MKTVHMAIDLTMEPPNRGKKVGHEKEDCENRCQRRKKGVTEAKRTNQREQINVEDQCREAFLRWQWFSPS
jgi:hypothetical protein